MMTRIKNVKGILGILTVAIVLCSGCGGRGGNETDQSGSAAESADAQATAVQTTDTPTDTTQAVDMPPKEVQATVQDASKDIQPVEDLDVVEPDAADDKWYMAGTVYTDDTGRRLEVFFDDVGMLEFSVDGLSLYYTSADGFQQENNWKVYTCDDGTMIIYYPGNPAHLEISDGEYAGLYEAGGKVK